MGQKNITCFLSLVIPVFNEEKRVVAGLTSAVSYLKQKPYTWEIIVVDDGSTDATVAVAKKMLRGVPHELIQLNNNEGKGAAIKSGVLSACGKCILFSDIDFSTPLTELPAFFEALKKTDVAIGVRRHPRSEVIKHQPRLREFLGHIFTKLTNLIATPGIYDATCGFKMFSQDAAYTLFSHSRIKRWAFDAEILFLARKYNYTITQVPVVWSDNAATKVHVLRDGARAFIDLIYMRITDLMGNYE